MKQNHREWKRKTQLLQVEIKHFRESQWKRIHSKYLDTQLLVSPLLLTSCVSLGEILTLSEQSWFYHMSNDSSDDNIFILSFMVTRSFYIFWYNNPGKWVRQIPILEIRNQDSGSLNDLAEVHTVAKYKMIYKYRSSKSKINGVSAKPYWAERYLWCCDQNSKKVRLNYLCVYREIKSLVFIFFLLPISFLGQRP